MRNDAFAYTLVAMFIPPGLLTLVGTEKPRSRAEGVIQFRTAIFADLLAFRCFRSHAVSSTEGFDGVDRDAQSIRYCSIGNILLTHGFYLIFLFVCHSNLRFRGLPQELLEMSCYFVRENQKFPVKTSLQPKARVILTPFWR